LFARLRDAVAKMSGVKSVEARPATGSLIVAHDSSTDDLIAVARDAGVFLVEEVAEAYAPSFEAAALKTRIDTFLKETLGKGFDVRSVAAFAFIAMALRQLAAGRIMPPAATALWYGLSLLLMTGVPPGAAPDGGDGGDGGE
jgi:hypothetical protein